jgi:hypothetical protein
MALCGAGETDTNHKKEEKNTSGSHHSHEIKYGNRSSDFFSSLNDCDVVNPHWIGTGGRIREAYNKRVNHSCWLWIDHRSEVSKGVRQRVRDCKLRGGIP